MMGGIGADYPSRPMKFPVFALGVRGHKEWGRPDGQPAGRTGANRMPSNDLNFSPGENP